MLLKNPASTAFTDTALAPHQVDAVTPPCGVSLRGCAQNVFIQCETGNSPAKSLVHLLQPLQLLELIHPLAAALLAPTIIRLFRNLELANSVNT